MRHKDATRLQLVIPFHQPLTVNAAAMATLCDTCYVPLVAALEANENARVALHFGGHVLDYLARSQEGLLLRVKSLCKRGQVEVLGGLFYGGITALLGELDVRGQVEMAAEYWDSFLGVIPQGFWLHNLAWTPELPRLLEDTGLEYGFISQSQVSEGAQNNQPIGQVTRGGAHVSAFVLHRAQSQELTTTPVAQWLTGVHAAAQHTPWRLLSVWTPAEQFARQGHDFAGWLRAVTADKQVALTLPAESFPALRPRGKLLLRAPCAPELGMTLGQKPAVDWVDFTTEAPELDTLYRRMLRASDKLREAIGVMEDEELEETWSDHLATAQRLVFSAQSADVYGSGPTGGYQDAALRDATFARLVRAEGVIEELVHGADEWMTHEEHDLDGDGAADLFIGSRHLTAWLQVHNGFAVRSLEPRGLECNVLDVCNGTTTAMQRGIVQGLLMPNASRDDFFASKTPSQVAHAAAWAAKDDHSESDGDNDFQLTVEADVPVLSGGTLRCLQWVRLPANEATLRLHFEWQPASCGPLLWAMQIPLRLGLQGTRLHVDGRAQATGGSITAAKATVVGAAGEQVTVTFSQALTLWWQEARAGGLVLVPVLPIDKNASLTVAVSIAKPA